MGVMIDPETATPLPLKLKYRVVRNTRGGSYSQRTGNSSGTTPKHSKSMQGTGVRRRAYHTHVVK